MHRVTREHDASKHNPQTFARSPPEEARTTTDRSDYKCWSCTCRGNAGNATAAMCWSMRPSGDAHSSGILTVLSRGCVRMAAVSSAT